jgi:hypothetical protein
MTDFVLRDDCATNREAVSCTMLRVTQNVIVKHVVYTIFSISVYFTLNKILFLLKTSNLVPFNIFKFYVGSSASRFDVSSVMVSRRIDTIIYT